MLNTLLGLNPALFAVGTGGLHPVLQYGSYVLMGIGALGTLAGAPLAVRQFYRTFISKNKALEQLDRSDNARALPRELRATLRGVGKPVAEMDPDELQAYAEHHTTAGVIGNAFSQIGDRRSPTKPVHALRTALAQAASDNHSKPPTSAAEAAGRYGALMGFVNEGIRNPEAEASLRSSTNKGTALSDGEVEGTMTLPLGLFYEMLGHTKAAAIRKLAAAERKAATVGSGAIAIAEGDDDDDDEECAVDPNSTFASAVYALARTAAVAKPIPDDRLYGLLQTKADTALDGLSSTGRGTTTGTSSVNSTTNAIAGAIAGKPQPGRPVPAKTARAS